MSTTAKSITSRELITAEEYRQLKRRLFDLRCRYAKLLSEIRDRGATDARIKRQRNLEKRIEKLERHMARCEIITDDIEPITFREIFEAAVLTWQATQQVLSEWTARVRSRITELRNKTNEDFTLSWKH